MSNKTQKSNTDATESELKTRKSKRAPGKYIFVAILLAAVVLFGVYVLFAREDNAKSQPCVKTNTKSKDCLLKLEYAQSPEEQMRGLSGRANLPTDEGLMFIFMAPGQQCFWMKDMNFPIDIIWLSPNKEIQHIEKNVSPNTYPSTFCPIVDSQYVLEVNAGITDKLGFSQGQKLAF